MLPYLFKGKSPGAAGLLASWIQSGFQLAEKRSQHESAVTIKSLLWQEKKKRYANYFSKWVFLRDIPSTWKLYPHSLDLSYRLSATEIRHYPNLGITISDTMLTLDFGSHYNRQNSTFQKLLMSKKHGWETKRLPWMRFFMIPKLSRSLSYFEGRGKKARRLEH